MNKLIIYINDNEIQIIKDKIITFTSPSINNSNIIEETIFIKDFKKFLKDHKLISSIIYYPINIYLNYQVLPKDIVYYNYLFDKLNLTLNKVLCINDLLDKDKKYLLYNNNSLYYIDSNSTYNIDSNSLNYYLDNIPKLYIFGNKEFKGSSKHIIFSNYSTYIACLIKNSQDDL